MRREKYDEPTGGLLRFLEESPTAFHAVAGLGKVLDERGYRKLDERERWEISPGGKYYVTRNSSSIIAFQIGDSLEDYSFKVAASHCDSPCFRIKEEAEISVGDRYTKLNTERYGSMLCSTWLDRPLSAAGRAVLKTAGGWSERLVMLDRDLFLIPSLAIHMDREANEGRSFNKQIDMLPLFGEGGMKGDLKKLVAEELAAEPEEIYGMDLYLYSRVKPAVWGRRDEFLSASRLDDLECAWTSLQGFVEARPEGNVNVFACFDNEEVGSNTKQGAGSTFLADVLLRINDSLSMTGEDYRRALASSFMVSCDNAHAVHPNYPEKSDPDNCVYMNRGIAVKCHAGQQYTSDAVSIALWKGICERAGVPLQFFANRSDMRGGSTLGNIAMSQVSMNAVDVGLPQLAMHSAYETAGVRDVGYMIRAMRQFFDSGIGEYTLCRERVGEP